MRSRKPTKSFRKRCDGAAHRPIDASGGARYIFLSYPGKEQVRPVEVKLSQNWFRLVNTAEPDTKAVNTIPQDNRINFGAVFDTIIMVNNYGNGLRKTFTFV